MDQQHPIPQQISSYQFRLVGDMTLKQFFQLAGGLLISLIFYASPLHPIIKWPLIIFFAILGVALAFLPFEERPLEKWIVAFFRSIYSPTLFSWKQGAISPKFFQDEAQVPEEKILAPRGQEALKNYLAAPSTFAPLFSKLEEAEKIFLSRMGELFGPGSAPSGTVQLNQKPASQGITQVVPEIQEVPIPQTIRPKIVVEERDLTRATPSEFKLAGVAQTLQAQGSQDAHQASFSAGAAPPMPPDAPNTVSGQVMDASGKIVEGAILEIRDAAGRPVRALRSNKVGHFFIVTPLINGNYEIITEKEGLAFEPLTFEATGSIIPPIAIRAKTISSQNFAPNLIQPATIPS